MESSFSSSSSSSSSSSPLLRGEARSNCTQAEAKRPPRNPLKRITSMSRKLAKALAKAQSPFQYHSTPSTANFIGKPRRASEADCNRIHKVKGGGVKYEVLKWEALDLHGLPSNHNDEGIYSASPSASSIHSMSIPATPKAKLGVTAECGRKLILCCAIVPEDSLF